MHCGHDGFCHTDVNDWSTVVFHHLGDLGGGDDYAGFVADETGYGMCEMVGDEMVGDRGMVHSWRWAQKSEHPLFCPHTS